MNLFSVEGVGTVVQNFYDEVWGGVDADELLNGLDSFLTIVLISRFLFYNVKHKVHSHIKNVNTGLTSCSENKIRDNLLPMQLFVFTFKFFSVKANNIKEIKESFQYANPCHDLLSEAYNLTYGTLRKMEAIKVVSDIPNETEKSPMKSLKRIFLKLIEKVGLVFWIPLKLDEECSQ